MVQTIRVPGAIDLSRHRIAVGDTTAFVTKINTTQQVLEEFSTELSDMAYDLQQVSIVATQVISAAQAAAADLQSTRDLMDVNLSPAVDSALARIAAVEPVTEADLHAHSLYF